MAVPRMCLNAPRTGRRLPLPIDGGDGIDVEGAGTRNSVSTLLFGAVVRRA
jgi:hypothetical protein